MSLGYFFVKPEINYFSNALYNLINTKQVIENYKLQNFVNTITDDKMSVKTSGNCCLIESSVL
jgi:hypothetical protein